MVVAMDLRSCSAWRRCESIRVWCCRGFRMTRVGGCRGDAPGELSINWWFIQARSLKLSVMTARSDRRSEPWQWPPHRLPLQDRVLGRWWARRMSRRFAGVGVNIPAARLREMMAGAPLASDESIDVNFALAATEIKREQRLARLKRTQRRAVQWLIIAGVVLAALNLLICMGYVFVSLALHELPR